MQEFGLTNDPAANAEQFRDWKLGEAAAYFYPEATPDGLELAADLMGWYFAPSDDQFDGALGKNPRWATDITQDLVAILDLDVGAALPATYPVATGFADLWWRSCRGMSPAWRQRAAQHWRQYFIGQLAEVVNRRHGRQPDVVSCLRQRTVTTSCGPLTDLIERVSGYEVPDIAWHTPVIDELRQLTGEIIGITNDLVSSDKERAQGDTANNVLLVLENHQHCSRDEAIERMRQMTHERFERFLRLEQQAPDLDDILTQQGRIALRRFVSGLHDMLAGDNEWEHTSSRYSTTTKQDAPPRTSNEYRPPQTIGSRSPILSDPHKTICWRRTSNLYSGVP
jgi:Terpene synthase family 2, C-terminal metal binding